MSKILNIALVTLLGFGAAKAQQIQITPHNNPKPPTINFQELLETNKLPVDEIVRNLDKLAFGYQLKKDLLEYGELFSDNNKIVGWQGRGFNPELGREVHVAFYPVVTEKTFQRSSVGEFVAYNDKEMFEITIFSEGTEYETLTDKLFIYDGEFGTLDGEVDFIKGINEVFQPVILYNRLYEKTPEQIASKENVDYLLEQLGHYTRLDAKVLAKAGIPF